MISDPTLICCPRCGGAGGNEVDRVRRITQRCQFCGYPKQLRRDRWYFRVARRFAWKVYHWCCA